MSGSRWKWLPVAWGLCLAVRYLFHNHLYAVDDSYITFRYAEHFSLGEGLVFNLGERYYGTTAAGYALLLGGLRAVTRLLSMPIEVPLLGGGLSAIGLGLVAVHACRRVWQSLAPRSPAAAATACCFAIAFVFMAPMSSVVPGHETYWFLGLIAAGLTLTFDLDRPASGMAVLLVAATTRPDGMLLVLVVGGLNVLRARGSKLDLRRVLLVNVGAAGGLAIWFAGLRMYFGQFLPGTMAAKQALYTTHYWTALDWRTFQLGLEQYVGPAWPLVFLFALLTLVGLARHSLPFAEVAWLVFFVVSTGFYCSVKVIYCAWYVIPACFALTLGGLRLFAALAARSSPRSAWPAATLLCAAVAVPATEGMFAFALERQTNGHLVAYRPVIDYLRQEAPQGTSVAIMEPGNFGFELGPEYQVVDLLGLSSPGVASALLARDWGYAIRTFRPKFVVLAYGMPFSPDAVHEFAADYEKVDSFYAGADNSPVGVTTVYRARR